MASWAGSQQKQREPCDLPTPKSTASFWHKSPSALLTGHRSTRQLPEKADIVIIGSGMTATGAAHHLLTNPKSDEPLNVVMLEAREACWGATGRNGGHCQPILYEHPNDPTIGAFELANFHTINALIVNNSIDCEFVAQPGVRSIYSRGHLNEIELALLKVKALAPEQASMLRLVTNEAELASLRIPTALGAVVNTTAGRMWPYKFVSRILEDLIQLPSLANGSTFNLQTLTPVTSIETSHGDKDFPVSVQTARGKIHTKKVIVATNGYTSHILPQFADLIVPCRGQMSALVPYPSISGTKRLTTSVGFLGDGIDDYLIQRPNSDGAHLMFGGGRHMGPSMGVTDDSVIDEPTAHYLRTRLVDILALPEGKQSHAGRSGDDKYASESALTSSDTSEMQATHIWTGIMGYSRDERPWVGRVPGQEHVYIAAGYTGHGMPNTWLCGKAVAIMAEISLVAEEDGDAAGLQAARRETRLPQSYEVSKERIQAAMEKEDVEVSDWADMAKARRTQRRASGYA